MKAHGDEWAGTRWAREPHIRFGDPCYDCAVSLTPACRGVGRLGRSRRATASMLGSDCVGLAPESAGRFVHPRQLTSV